MQQQIVRETLKVDEDHMLHIELPEDFSDEVEVIIMPLSPQRVPQESKAMMRLQEESAFAQEVLGSSDEDVWNELLK
jgi:hypothetical protein